jgi:hypothetical protein
MRAPVPITPFLSGQAFEPDVLRNMSAAFETVCEKLGLIIRHDPATELVAKFIIELAQRGVHDVDALLKAALSEFDLNK